MTKKFLFTTGLALFFASLSFFSTGKSKDFREWASIPPMGWNSWDCYGPTVVESEVKANADYMAEKLKDYGWEYIVVDIRWFVENDKAGGYNQSDPRYVMDEYGRYLPAINRFPSAADGVGFKALADYIHSKGLKFGIHIMRGIPKEAVAKKLPVKGTKGITADRIYSTEQQCPWLRDNYTIDATQAGAQEYYNSIMELYASWGVDFIKIDDLSKPYHQAEIEMIRKAIDKTKRPIVLSTSPGKTPFEKADHVSTHANMWRMVDDVWDIWGDLKHLMQVAQDWYPYIQPGTWPDCDMIPLGRISIRGERGEERMTRLTKNEQYALMSFFCIFRSPLMFGGDLPNNDEFTLSLMTNKEVLKMHREGTQVRQLYQKDDQVAVTAVNGKTGEIYLALFNMNDFNPQTLEVDFDEIGLGDVAYCAALDLWQNKTLQFKEKVSCRLDPHACILLKLKKDVNYKTENSHNPVLKGLYADPDILYSEKTGKFYIYPTSDGFDGWSGTYFKTFSSPDLVNWTDEGVILDLLKDVSWANRNAWAPCIIEKKIDGQYRYFYYFTAAQKIGVAVSDDPAGPFVDSGRPLINFRPEGVRGGQEIDPDVFMDPVTGKSYLYWGNGYMAVAELNEDMISLKEGSLKVMHPDRTFREGTHVLYRNGLYYFLWSEDDTRSENYRVRYGYSDSPTGDKDGRFTIPEDNLIIAKNPESGIYATGHNSTIQIPGKDEWYIVYHRFNYPNGIHQGDPAGFNREVCIDKMIFDKDGKILRTTATHEGIKPVKVKIKK